MTWQAHETSGVGADTPQVHRHAEHMRPEVVERSYATDL